MICLSHRGIYEYLWSQHKYAVLGVSSKAFAAMGDYFGRCPKILPWLHKLSVYANSEHTELYNALLNAYMHVKPHISRRRQEEIIELILNNESAASEMIFRSALEHNEDSLFNCRLFYDFNKGIYKFFDTGYNLGGKLGLWLCFGPFQLFLSLRQVIYKISVLSGVDKLQIHSKLQVLKGGVSKEEFLSWNKALQNELAANNFVAEPGGLVQLNPKINLDCLFDENEPEQIDADAQTTAALALEALNDSEIGENSYLGQLPDIYEFKSALEGERLAFLPPSRTLSADAAYEWLQGQFATAV